MNARIWKFEFDIHDRITIQMPKGAKILHVECQDNMPCIWALVNADAPRETRSFRIVGTGHPIPDIADLRHVATFQMADGQLVWHLFEPANVIEDLLGLRH